MNRAHFLFLIESALSTHVHVPKSSKKVTAEVIDDEALDLLRLKRAHAQRTHQYNPRKHQGMSNHDIPEAQHEADKTYERLKREKNIRDTIGKDAEFHEKLGKINKVNERIRHHLGIGMHHIGKIGVATSLLAFAGHLHANKLAKAKLVKSAKKAAGVGAVAGTMAAGVGYKHYRNSRRKKVREAYTEHQRDQVNFLKAHRQVRDSFIDVEGIEKSPVYRLLKHHSGKLKAVAAASTLLGALGSYKLLRREAGQASNLYHHYKHARMPLHKAIPHALKSIHHDIKAGGGYVKLANGLHGEVKRHGGYLKVLKQVPTSVKVATGAAGLGTAAVAHRLIKRRKKHG